MNLAENIMAEARNRNLGHFFGIPGGGSPLDFIEAGRKLDVRFVNVAHESSAAIAAAYYGGLKKTAGLAMCVRGVGAANLVGGAANVHFERMPLVAITEATPSGLADRENIQSCPQWNLFEGISKYQAVLTGKKAASMIQESFHAATDGRPGPAILHLPTDLQEAEENKSLSQESQSNDHTQELFEAAKVKDIIKKSRHPVILAGADIVRMDACAELRKLAESIEAAVLVSMDARGVFPESHPRWGGVYLGMGNPNVIESRILQEADFVLVVGVDAMMTHTLWRSAAPTCELVARKEYTTLTTPDIRINGNLKSLITQLDLPKQPGFSESEIQILRAGILENFKRPSHARLAAQDIIEITREILPKDGVLFSETGAFVCMLEHLWKVDRPGTYFGTSGGRTMGLMIPAILGGKLSDPATPMAGMGADGSLLMRLGELEVFARMGIRVPLIIINDQALGTMKARQAARGMPDYGLDFHAVEFSTIAGACGLNGVTADTPEAFKKELVLALQADRSTLIDARVDASAYQDSFGPTIGDLSSLPKRAE